MNGVRGDYASKRSMPRIVPQAVAGRVFDSPRRAKPLLLVRL
jgi:hypothetical protein